MVARSARWDTLPLDRIFRRFPRSPFLPRGTSCSAGVELEEGGGLDPAVGHQGEQDEDEGDEEAPEAQVLRADLHGDDHDVDEGRKDAPQSLASHHAPHVVGGELATHTWCRAI